MSERTPDSGSPQPGARLAEPHPGVITGFRKADYHRPPLQRRPAADLLRVQGCTCCVCRRSAAYLAPECLPGKWAVGDGQRGTLLVTLGSDGEAKQSPRPRLGIRTVEGREACIYFGQGPALRHPQNRRRPRKTLPRGSAACSPNPTKTLQTLGNQTPPTSCEE